ncbi:MAG: hypothetical protein FWG85_04480 [Bacteroidetes bacterium]|nr:hypothetical protein [Bacteroidota bacterium]
MKNFKLNLKMFMLLLLLNVSLFAQAPSTFKLVINIENTEVPLNRYIVRKDMIIFASGNKITVMERTSGAVKYITEFSTDIPGIWSFRVITANRIVSVGDIIGYGSATYMCGSSSIMLYNHLFVL